MKRVGHGGTLDPAATGVLPIALGRATRLLQFLQHDKAYQATVRFGVRTATDDLEGEILTSSPVQLSLEQVQPYLPKFEGQIQQIPPSYSAIQVDGKRLYERARAGEMVEAPVRTVSVYRIEVLGWRSGEFPELDLAIACGSGTYIRSIARDLGEVLGTGGTLALLKRTFSNGFSLENSLTLADLEQQAGCFEPIAPLSALPHLPVAVLAGESVKRWRQGQRVICDSVLAGSPPSPTEQFCCVQQDQGSFLGIGMAIADSDLTQLIPKLVWQED